LGETTRDDDPETRTRERAFERDGKDAENLSAREPARRFVRTSTADTTSVSVAPSTSCVSFVGFESDSLKKAQFNEPSI